MLLVQSDNRKEGALLGWNIVLIYLGMSRKIYQESLFNSFSPMAIVSH